MLEIVLPKLWIVNCHLHFAEAQENALMFSEFDFGTVKIFSNQTS